MKKLLALLLLSPLVVSEEIEYPIQLTCEAGAPYRVGGIYIVFEYFERFLKR